MIELPLPDDLFSILSYERDSTKHFVLCTSPEHEAGMMAMALCDSQVDLHSVRLNGLPAVKS
jgi:hypothetical protein